MSYQRINCQICGNSFYAKTSKAKYCSPACKQKNYRKNQDRIKEAIRVTLTFQEHSFMRQLEEIDPTLHDLLNAAMRDGDFTLLRAVYHITRYPDECQKIVEDGLNKMLAYWEKKNESVTGYVPDERYPF